jgi:hypothetical protein
MYRILELFWSTVMEALCGFFLLLKTFGGLTLAPITLLNRAESSLSNSPDSPTNDRDAVWESDYQDDSADARGSPLKSRSFVLSSRCWGTASWPL